MEEQLVSFETAKLAKEMGYFNGCRASYTHFYEDYIYDNDPEHPESHKKDQINLNDRWFHKNLSEEDCSNEHFTVYEAPTQSLLQKWLREKHSTDIQILGLIGHYFVGINKKDFHECSQYFYPSEKSYEDVLEIGLQESLKLIK